MELTTILDELLAKFPLKDLKAAAEELSLSYREGERRGQSFIENGLFAAAYFISRMPATAGAISAALREALKIYKSTPKTVLDMGAGTGACALALRGLNIEKITLIEREQEMLKLGVRVTDTLKLPAEWKKGEIADKIGAKYDLVVASYMLNELPEQQLRAAIENLWNATEGILLIVENGAKGGFNTLKAATKILKGLGGNVIAPCPKVDECPLEKGDWCHFTARIQRTKPHKLLKGGNAPYEDEKFCFLAVSRTDRKNCSARVLRHPKISSGKIELSLCTEKGIENRIVTKRDKESFKRARKASAGEEF